MRLVQFELSNGERRVGVVEGDQVREVQGARTVRDLALAAIEVGVKLEQQVNSLGLGAYGMTTPGCSVTCASCRHWTTRTRRTCWSAAPA